MERFYGAGRSMIDIGPVRIGDLAFARTCRRGSLPARSDHDAELGVLQRGELCGQRLPEGRHHAAHAGGLPGRGGHGPGDEALLRDVEVQAPPVRGLLRRGGGGERAGPGLVFRPVLQESRQARLRRQRCPFAGGRRSGRPDRAGRLRIGRGREREEGKRGREGEEPKSRKSETPGTAPKMYDSEVVVVRNAELVFPQEILVVFEDGTEVRETWDGKSRWKRFEYAKPVKLKMARLDPEFKIPIDANLTNNSRLAEPDMKPLRRHALGVFLAFQKLLSLVAF